MKFGGKVILGVLFFLVGLTVVFAAANSNIAQWQSNNRTTDGNTFGVNIADVDGDGSNDIVVAIYNGNGGDKVSLYRNDGNADVTKWPVYNYSITGPNAVAVADIDGDGKKDIIVGTNTGNANTVIYILKNNGGADISQWAATKTGQLPGGVFSLATNDLDNDGKIDIVAGLAGGPGNARVSVYKNAGNTNIGQWAVNSVITADNVESVAVNDVDADGNKDIVIGIASGVVNPRVTVYYNSGNNLNIAQWAHFGANTVFNANTKTSVFPVAVADVDGDGKVDIIAGITGSDTSGGFWVAINKISAYINDGNRDISNWQVYDAATGSTPYSLAIGDIDNDGNPDIAAALSGSRVSLYTSPGNNGDVSAWAVSSTGTASMAFSVAIGDVDKDTDKDIVVGLIQGATGRLSVYKNPLILPVIRKVDTSSVFKSRKMHSARNKY